MAQTMVFAKRDSVNNRMLSCKNNWVQNGDKSKKDRVFRNGNEEIVTNIFVRIPNCSLNLNILKFFRF